MSRLSPDRLGLPRPSQDCYRAAFQRLSGLGRGERALFALISICGLSSASTDLLVEPAIVLGWISAGTVPADRVEDVCEAATRAGRHVRRGPMATGARDPRREQLKKLIAEGHSTRRLASILGVSRDTVMRWREEEEKVG